ncbi:MAG: AraC family transcriptional regulator [Bacteroidota bacterium]
MEKAKYLLLNSETTVSEIAYQLGFEYPAYFSRLFKKKVGVSPSDFKLSLN